MNRLLGFLRKLELLVRRDRFHRELGEEMAFHRELAEEEFRSDGLSAEEARHAARRRFGNQLRLQEQSQEVVGFRFEGVLQDLRFAVRQLTKNPGFASTAVLVLGLGIAASVAIFAFVDAALLQPLPYRDPSRLAAVYGTSASCQECEFSYQDYLDWKKDSTVFSSFEAWEFSVYLWRGAEGVKALRGARVSGGFFRTLGVNAMLGRVFSDADSLPTAPATVLLPYRTWQSRFGARQDIVGQSVILDGVSHTIIGVLPRGFHFAMRAAELWTAIQNPDNCEKTRTCHSVNGVARLRGGVSVQAALADMKAIASQTAKEYPDADKSQSALVRPLSEAVAGDIRPTLLLLLSGAVLLLLIACVNVSSLLLVRAENRRREMALRSALGASTARLVRLFVAEGVVLAVFAVTFGLSAAYAAIPWLFGLIPERVLRGMPYFLEVGLHPRVLLFGFMVALLAVGIFTLTPALRLSVSNLREDLAAGGRGSAGTTWKRFGSNLVAVELAIAMVLLAGAGLLGKSLYRLFHVDLNFNPSHIATIEVNKPDTGYTKPEQRVALSRRLIGQISVLPGVIAVGHASDLPVTCNCNTAQFRVLGHPWNGEHSEVLNREVSTDYFQVLQARLIRGRWFNQADDQSGTRVVLINRTLGTKFFPTEDPVGKTIGDADLSPNSLRQIVGVVDDVREGRLNDEIEPAMYSPFEQNPDGSFFIAVRTGQDAGQMLPVLTAAVQHLDSNLGVRNEFTMTQRIDNSSFLNRSSAWLVAAFAAIALLLGVVGLYGVIAYSVSRRTREIGVRMALGAQRAAVYRLILGEAGLVSAAGIAAGLGCSIASASLLRDFLFGVEAWDAPTLIAVAATLAACALLASYLPARRAASVNPIEALRTE